MHYLKTTFIVFGFCLLFYEPSFSQNKTIQFFGRKPLKADTIHSLNMLQEFVWNVRKLSHNGTQQQNVTCIPDSLDDDELDSSFLSTTFNVESHLLNHNYYLHYSLYGSVKISINKKVILETGIFSNNKDADQCNFKQDDYAPFILSDTIINIQINYLAHPKIKSFTLKLAIGDEKWGKQKIAEQKQTFNEGYSLGFFYLAFAILFLMFFIYYRRNIEHFYFSMFCLFSAINYLSNTAILSVPVNNLLNFSIVFAIEFLAIFYAKVIANTKRSKIPLSIYVLIFLLSCHPYFLYDIGGLSGNSTSFSGSLFLIIPLVYSSFSVLYYLLQGFGQRKWQEKVITFGSLIALVFTVLVPMVMGLSGALSGKYNPDNFLMTFLNNFGLCLFPLTIAFVLARRNGENQKQLIQQVQSIEKLSKENLEKEQEKKQILENQKSELEIKVVERTQEVWQQKEVIEIKNKEITDSLNYAKRIQSAILPDVRLIYKTLEQAFILYLPKDIVSGDFYAFAQKENKVLIAAADCTGHGVAGAFMSMIGSSVLNHIINERKITEPSVILDHLNEEIIQSLNQKENESNDGMDISICTFDLSKNELVFAGAQRPLWLIRNNELLFYKPNKFAIGGTQVVHDEKFSQHIIPLQKNDTIYIFTDGYADQFGGDKGKKLMTKKFRETLLSIQNKPMHEQELYLKQYFENWKGMNEQVDDVLVIGIRI